MVSSLFLAMNLVPLVSVEAAYTLNTSRPVEVRQCCGLCKDGVVTHGDGHVTPCSCPEDCKCKAKTLTHPPVQIHPCPDGKCKLKPSK